MTEQSGRLEAAVDAYLNGDRLPPAAIGLIKQYLRQYLERALMTGAANRGALLRKIETLRDNRDDRALCRRACGIWGRAVLRGQGTGHKSSAGDAAARGIRHSTHILPPGLCATCT